MSIISISHLSQQEFPWQAELIGGLGKSALTKEQLIEVCPGAAEWLAVNEPIVISETIQDAKLLIQNERIMRNDELAATDHLMLPDAALSPADLQAVIDYRKGLRDYPSTKNWPVKPTALN